MNFYKPHSYLYKDERSSPKKLTSCFVVKVPTGKSLNGPDITENNDEFTIYYAIENDQNQSHDRQEEYENELTWSGDPVFVKIVIGDGSNGGSVSNSTDHAEEIS